MNYLTGSPYRDITHEEYDALMGQISQASAFVGSIDALKQIDISNVNTGYQVGLSGVGGGTFYWDSNSSEPDNGGTVIASNNSPNGRWKRIYDGEFVRAEWFGEGFEGLRKAWAASKFIELNPATTYTFDGETPDQCRLVSYEQPVHIRGNGARLEQVTNETLIALRGGWENIQNVVSFSLDNKTITVEDGSKFKRGDVVKIRNDEQLPDFPSRYRGEFFVVYNVSGNDLISRQSLRFHYSLTNCRVGKLQSHKITVEDLEVEYTVTDEGNGTDVGDLIYVENALEPTIKNVSSPFGFGNIVHCRESYAGTIKDINVGYQANSENDWQSGTTNYGVRIHNSELFRVDGGTYRNGRHGVDFLSSTDTGLDFLNPAGKPNLNGAGLARNSIVTNWQGDGGSNAPFSTHHGSENIRFADCTAHNVRNVGFQLRGTGHVAESCQTYNCPIGFRSFVQSSYLGSANTHRVVFKNCTVNDPIDSAFEIRDNSEDVIIDGCDIIFTADSRNKVPLRLIDVREEGKVQVYNTKVIARRPILRLRDFIEFRNIPAGQTFYVTLNGVEIVAPTGADADMNDVLRTGGEGDVLAHAFNVRGFALMDDAPIVQDFIRGNLSPMSVMHNIYLPEFAGDKEQVSDGASVPLSHGNIDAPDDNFALGQYALENVNADTNFNIAFGKRALRSGNSIYANVAVGHSSAQDATSARDNTIVGHETARDLVEPRDGSLGGPVTEGSQSLTTGEKNVLIGRRASVATGDTSHAIVIGVDAYGETGDLVFGSHSYNVGFDGYDPYDEAGAQVGYLRVKLNDRYFRIPLYDDDITTAETTTETTTTETTTIDTTSTDTTSTT